jgi:hypothetical protein
MAKRMKIKPAYEKRVQVNYFNLYNSYNESTLRGRKPTIFAQLKTLIFLCNPATNSKKNSRAIIHAVAVAARKHLM